MRHFVALLGLGLALSFTPSSALGAHGLADEHSIACNDRPNPLPDEPGLEICPDRITVTVDGQRMKVPYCRNYPLGRKNRCVDRAIVVIHGTRRNALSYYNRVLMPALEARTAGNTMVIAPQFVTENEIDAFGIGEDHLYWSSGGWKNGSFSKSSQAHPRSVRYSSFSVVDDILTRLQDRRRFPNLKHIVIAGHSAGGQFVNRFAAGSQVEPLQGFDPIAYRYIVANPSSYLYFTPERRIEGQLDQFALPNASACLGYNEYKYGLEDLFTYMANTTPARIVQQYPQREVVYLLGSEDNDPNSSSLDRDCEAMLQGQHRLERGIVYYNHLQGVFGPQIIDRHAKSIIDGVGHSSTQMFSSECGMRYLFDHNPRGVRCRVP